MAFHWFHNSQTTLGMVKLIFLIMSFSLPILTGLHSGDSASIPGLYRFLPDFAVSMGASHSTGRACLADTRETMRRYLAIGRDAIQNPVLFLLEGQRAYSLIIRRSPVTTPACHVKSRVRH